jgi:hypothetical protein
MSYRTILSVLVLALVALVGCGGGRTTVTSDAVGEGYRSDVLDTDYEGALDVGSQLALGTLQLEETGHAVTSNQAKTLLLLWQALQGGVTAEDEIEAVLRGIEGAMTEEQLTAIAAMKLTQEDMQAWVEEQGMGALGGFPGVGDMSEEELEAARATRQATGGAEVPRGGEMPSGGEGVSPGGQMPSGEGMPPAMATRRAQLQSMTEEEREALRATAQAGGSLGARARAGAGGAPGVATGRVGQVRLLVRPLIALLAERAG